MIDLAGKRLTLTLADVLAVKAVLLDRLVLSPARRLQLDRIVRRIREHHKVALTYDDAVVKLVVSRCTEVESGGRAIGAILTNTVLPRISEKHLTRMVEGRPPGAIVLRVTDGDFSFDFA